MPRFVEGHAGIRDCFVQLGGEVDTVIYGQRRGAIVVVKRELRGWLIQGEVEWSSALGTVQAQVARLCEWLGVLLPVLGMA